MTAKILPPKLAAFVQELMLSPAHRKMLHIGMALTKVSAMFQLTESDDVPVDATGVFILLLEGLESGSAAEYARCEAMAMQMYQAWMASREVH